MIYNDKIYTLYDHPQNWRISRIQIYDLDLKILKYIDTKTYSISLDIYEDSNILIIDCNNEIKKYDKKRKMFFYLTKTKIVNPKRIRIFNDKIYVIGSSHIKVFDLYGKKRESIYIRDYRDICDICFSQEYMYIICDFDKVIQIELNDYSNKNVLLDKLKIVKGICAYKNYIYIVETMKNRIIKIDSLGKIWNVIKLIGLKSND